MANQKNEHLQIVIDVVMHWKKYMSVVNVPNRIEAAIFLCENHWDQLTSKQAKTVEQVLVDSKLYERIS